MRLIAGAVDWTGDPPVASVEAMLNRPAAWGDRSGKSILRAGAAALGALDFGEQVSGVQGVTARCDLLVAVDARFDDLSAMRATLDLTDVATDAELVAAAYLRWGTSFPRHLSGEFAVMLWDGRQRCLVAARDPLGVRPLFLASGHGRLLVSSDLEAILATGDIAPDPDDDVVINYVRWTVAEPEATFYRHIRRVRAGHVLVAKDGRATSTDYREISSAQASFSDREECWAEFRRLFFQAVRRRMVSPSPVVIQVSGGLDSTAIARVADEILREDPALCGGVVAAGALHPGLQCDESAYIREVERSVAFPVETWDGSAADARELLDTPASMPGGRYVLTGGTEGDVEIARRLGARVVLSGIGGDQLGSPDGVIEDAVSESRWLDAAKMLWGAPGSKSSKLRGALRVAKAVSPPLLRSLHRSRKGSERVAPLLTTWAARRGNEAPAVDPWSQRLRTHVQRRRWEGLTNPRMLMAMEYTQQHSLRAAVEVRFPFLDLDLVRFVLSIPSRFLPPSWPQERLHRDALVSLLPGPIRRRRTKAEFSSALAHRVTSQLPVIRSLQGDGQWRMGRYVEEQRARQALRVFETSPVPDFTSTWAIWAISSVEAWLRASSGYTSRPWEGY